MQPQEAVGKAGEKFEELVEQIMLKQMMAEEVALYRERERVCKAMIAFAHRFPGERKEEGQIISAGIPFANGEIYRANRQIFVVAEVRHDWDDELYSSAKFHFFVGASDVAGREDVPITNLHTVDGSIVPVIKIDTEWVPSITIEHAKPPTPEKLMDYRQGIDKVQQTLATLNELYPPEA